MAQKRMFDKNVVSSDKFLDLPNSSKALYFMAGMEADDKGFFQPRKLQRMCGFSDDDYKILIAKGFFIAFESGVMVVTDWNKNNWLDSRRMTKTEYIDELNMLKLTNNKYELANTTESKCLANAKPMLSQNSIEENSIEENSIEESSIEQKFSAATTPNENCINFYIENINPLVTQYEIDTLNDYCNDLSDELIINAIKEAIEYKARNLKYVKKILDRYISQGIKNLKQLQLQEDINKNENKKEETAKEETAKEEAERLRKKWGLSDED